MKKKSTKGIFVIDKLYYFDRPAGYVPLDYVTAEDEIKKSCNDNRIAVVKITKFDGYAVIGRRVRSKESCSKLQEVIDKQHENI
jgi:hypothetical protein